MQQLYAGIDLHSNSSFLGISDEEDKRLYRKRLPNESDVVLAKLESSVPILLALSSSPLSTGNGVESLSV
jgi:hypothetical protein